MSEFTRLHVSGSPGSTESIIGFLEKKAAFKNQPPLKVHKYNVLNDGSGIIIEVSQPERFLHLNGFQHMGSTLSVVEDHSFRSNSRQNQNQQQRGFQSQQQSGSGLADRISRPQNNNQINQNTRQPFNAPRQPSGQRQPFGTSREIFGQPRTPSGPQSQQPRSQTRSQTSGFPGAQNNNTNQISQIPKGPARYEDPDGIAETFLRKFFPCYDTNRELVLEEFYDPESQFSLSITMRGANHRGKSLDWSEYLKRSRNLTRVHRSNARAARLFKGQEAIYDEWSQLPPTIHPTFEGVQLNEWLIECKQATNLPDPTGNSHTGVNGLLVVAHGAFEDQSKDKVVSKRSFDRSFLLGPGTGPSGVRVISDTLVLRPYSGNFASTNALPIIIPENIANTLAAEANVAATPNAPFPAHPEVPAGSGVGEPRPGKSDEQLLKEQRVLALSFETTLKLEWAEKCLLGNNWDMDAAKANLQTLIASSQIPPEAFLNVAKS